MKHLKISGDLVLLLLGVACSGNDDTPIDDSSEPIITPKGTPSGTSVSTSIGAAGGTIQSDDGNLTITIPEGALSATTVLSIQPITNEAPLGIGTGYRLGPEGTTFAKPVRLTFHYAGDSMQESVSDLLWIVTQATDGSWGAMLKSVVDKSARTVSVETTHFSDWTTGTFLKLSLNPKSTSVKINESIDLQLSGFKRKAKKQPQEEDPELTPLSKIQNPDDMDILTPIPPLELREQAFKVTGWTLNGVPAPGSGSDGTLNGNGKQAVYQAPSKKPDNNPVAVTVHLEGSNKEGRKVSYRITSSVTVVDDDYYLTLSIDGRNLTYSPNSESWPVLCGPDGNKLSIMGLEMGADQVTTNNIFGIILDNPVVGARALTCYSNDDVGFLTTQGNNIQSNYKLNYLERKGDPDKCETKDKCGVVTVTLEEYTGAFGSDVVGKFSGTIYDNPENAAKECKSSRAHAIEGEFRLKFAG
jgi:hypothetical protein